MPTQKKVLGKPIKRELPLVEQVAAGLAKRYAQERKPVELTVIMKVHNPSSKKINRLFELHCYITNLQSQLLRYHYEDPKVRRTDGAIALALRVWGVKGNRSRRLETVLLKVSRLPLPQIDLDPQNRYAPRLRTSACREVARNLILWFQDIIKPILEEKRAAARLAAQQNRAETKNENTKIEKRKKPIKRRRLTKEDREIRLTLDEIYDSWSKAITRYEHAAATIIPFGPYRGLTLEEAGRREIRWLMERLLTKEEIAQTLEYVESLISHGKDLTEDAVYADHPYRQDERYQRALRASRLVQRIFEPSGEVVILGALKNDELVRFRDELREMIAKGIALDAALPPIAEALQEAQQATEELASIKQAFEIFLYERMPKFPEIAEVVSDDEGNDKQRALYETRLNWFRVNPYRENDFEKFVSEQRERGARERLLKTGKDLRLPEVQPISFLGTMRPGDYRDCGLLFDHDTAEFVLAIKTRGEGDPVTQEELEERRQQQERQKRKGQLRYANLPETPFAPQQTTAVELLPLTWGEQSKRKRFVEKRQPFLQAIIERQRAAQQQLHAEAIKNGEEKAKLKDMRPETMPFGAARIVMERDETGKPEFFVHLKVEPLMQPLKSVATSVVGVHEHERGYSYAVVGLDGQVLRDDNGQEMVGDISIPAEVIPKTSFDPFSDNYVYEVANAIVQRAGSTFIGLEDTSHLKDMPTLSRKGNRLTFRRPSRRIAATLAYKARLSGLPQLWDVRNISPSRDCTKCLKRLPKGQSGLETRRFVTCPACRHTQEEVLLELTQHCANCAHHWPLDPRTVVIERYFVCPYCDAGPHLARHNTAIAVAHEMLRGIARSIKSKENQAEAETTAFEER